MGVTTDWSSTISWLLLLLPPFSWRADFSKCQSAAFLAAAAAAPAGTPYALGDKSQTEAIAAEQHTVDTLQCFLFLHYTMCSRSKPSWFVVEFEPSSISEVYDHTSRKGGLWKPGLSVHCLSTNLRKIRAWESKDDIYIVCQLTVE